MKTLASWAPAPNLTVIAVEAGELDWIVSVDGRDAEQDHDRACCPLCGNPVPVTARIYGRCAIFLLKGGR